MVRPLLSIAYFLEVGLLLVLVPWSTFWHHNYFADTVPVLRAILQNNFVRGAVSGLGILNLCVGLADLASLVSSRRITTRSRQPAIMQADGPSPE